MITRGEEAGRSMKRIKGLKYMVAEEYSTLGGEHTMQYTDGVS